MSILSESLTLLMGESSNGKVNSNEVLSVFGSLKTSHHKPLAFSYKKQTNRACHTCLLLHDRPSRKKPPRAKDGALRITSNV